MFTYKYIDILRFFFAIFLIKIILENEIFKTTIFLIIINDEKSYGSPQIL